MNAGDATDLDQADEEALAPTLSDEALEVASGAERRLGVSGVSIAVNIPSLCC
jgi:hypothetical protein